METRAADKSRFIFVLVFERRCGQGEQERGRGAATATRLFLLRRVSVSPGDHPLLCAAVWTRVLLLLHPGEVQAGRAV